MGQAGGFLGTTAILILMAVLVLAALGVVRLFSLWLPSAQSV
jgi:hypothetical protein